MEIPSPMFLAAGLIAALVAVLIGVFVMRSRKRALLPLQSSGASFRSGPPMGPPYIEVPRFCTSCGQPAEVAGRFCGRCGAAFPPP
jgi:hypothetical protein